MENRNGKSSNERRRYARFVLANVIEPITLRYALPKEAKKNRKLAASESMTQPAILTDLSGGGMSLITFLAPPHTKRLDMVLDIPGLDRIPVVGKVVRVREKAETFIVGIQFIKIQRRHQQRINDMAADNMDCETRLALSLPEACVRNCRFHTLCYKTQKAPHWPKRS